MEAYKFPSIYYFGLMLPRQSFWRIQFPFRSRLKFGAHWHLDKQTADAIHYIAHNI